MVNMNNNKVSLCSYPNQIGGTLQVPPSKSDSHRALIAAALSQSHCTVSNILFSKDIEATLHAIQSFGVGFERTEKSVLFEPSDIKTPSNAVACNESGSTLRFMIPWSFLVSGDVTYTGENHLKKRPLDDYERLFKAKAIEYAYDGELPMRVTGKAVSGEMVLFGNVSSQYYSGLFFVLPLMSADSEILVDGQLESKGYVDLTLATLARHGIKIENMDYKRFVIPGNQHYLSVDHCVEGDYSNAAFWIVAGQISKEIRLTGLNPNSLQRDKQVIDVVKQMGGRLVWEGDTLVSSPSKTRGTVIDASEIPDIIPILCVLAALSEGTTTVVNGARLRIKESDRIKSTVSELSKLGAHITETHDGMVIEGLTSLEGGVVNSWNDHRIAMAMTIASTRCILPVTIENPMAVTKSYPHFYQDFSLLGGDIHE